MYITKKSLFEQTDNKWAILILFKKILSKQLRQDSNPGLWKPTFQCQRQFFLFVNFSKKDFSVRTRRWRDCRRRRHRLIGRRQLRDARLQSRRRRRRRRRWRRLCVGRRVVASLLRFVVVRRSEPRVETGQLFLERGPFGVRLADLVGQVELSGFGWRHFRFFFLHFQPLLGKLSLK